MSCCSKTSTKTCPTKSGPGYRSPLDAMTHSLPETVLFVTCVRPHKNAPDYLATVDVDPKSSNYGKVIGRTEMSAIGDEVHHTGWNTCSSCHSDSSKCRNRLVLPCLNSDRVYIVRVEQVEDPEKSNNKNANTYTTSLAQSIEPNELHRLDVSAPHTTHCLPNGKLMISCLGDATGAARGSFLVIDPPNGSSTTFTPSHLWNKTDVRFGYDYWYQPRHDIMVSTEWGAPRAFKEGFKLEDLTAGLYGSSIHFWQWSTGELKQILDLRTIAPDTRMPLEVRFLHNPDAAEGYVGCALSGNVFRFYRDDEQEEGKGKWTAEEVIRIPPKTVSGWSMAELPALITDILISLDDRFLYVSAWAFGEVRQYDLSQRSSPPLVGVVRLGGILSNPSIKILSDPEPELIEEDQIVTQIKSFPLRAGAQMLQLSLDGARLYVTNSLHSAWDRQFYPEVIEHGSQLVKVNIQNTKTGGMSVDRDFLVDFGSNSEPNGPSLAHEMRYPGGDCTSDIWI